MGKFVSREKMSKKAQKRMDAENRKTWAFSPVTRTVESKKIYNRKRVSRAGYGDGAGDFFTRRGCARIPERVALAQGNMIYFLRAGKSLISR